LRAVGAIEKGAVDSLSQESVITPSSDSVLSLGLFEVMLSIALLSLRTCPLNVSTAIKQRFAQTQENVEALYQLFSEALKFKIYCERNMASIISVAQQCLWSSKPDARKFGAKLFKELFQASPKRREEYFFVLERMSIDNVKRLFRAVFRLYAARPSTKSHKDNLITMIPLLLRSADNVQPVFGILAVLLKMETALKLEDSPTREEDVRNTLELLDEARNSNQFVRTYCYAELAEVLRACFGCSKCIAMVIK
ncbi:unnamed protein product, partial [Cylicostephanus goldi]